ncbi:MAG: arylsulfatase A [Verrucomicrobiales bacterium]|jgi:arylsulfatase A
MNRILLTFTAALFSGIAQAKPTNIIFFLVDDLAWSDVGCFGCTFHETPNIDQFAKEGVKFTNAYAACHVCSPTRASILTGKYPARLNLTDWLKGRGDFPFQRLKNAVINQHLPYEEVTIAERLKELNYATGIFGKWHLGKKPSDPPAHGFDIHQPDVPSNWRTFHGPFGMKTFESKEGDYLTDRITDEALTWMEGKKDKPFFLYMSHFAVHDPIEGRADLVEKYTKKLAAMEKTDSPDFILEGNPDSPDCPTKEELTELIKTPEFARHGVLPRGTIKIRQKQDNIEFAAMVESVDQSLGRIVAKLEELEIEDDTIVIFFSDNGGMSAINVGNPQRVIAEEAIDKAYSTSCLPLRGAKGWLYEGGVRVPMIVKWPGQSKAGSVVEEPVMSTDFYPTILEMIGHKGETPDGQSFVTALKGEAFERGPLFWHFPHYSNHGMQSPASAIRDGDFKLIEYFENGSVQLFNLREDIGEHRNLASASPAKVEELQKKLHDWRKSVGAKMMEPNPEYNAADYPWMNATAK